MKNALKVVVQAKAQIHNISLAETEQAIKERFK
jgi:hypothetical protein